MLTLVERKTQLAKIIKLPRATAHATQRATVRRLKPTGDFVHTITKRGGKNVGRGLIPDRIDISERPTIVARKARLGDWEGDTVVSAGHPSTTEKSSLRIRKSPTR